MPKKKALRAFANLKNFGAPLPSFPFARSVAYDAPPTLDGIRTDRLVYLKRSAEGKTSGAYFAVAEGRKVVLKAAPDISQEYFCASLARLAGVAVPDCFFSTAVPQDLRRLMQAANSNVMVLELIRGLTFTDLLIADKATVLCAHTLRSIGHMVAFDYLIGNPDRFAVRGLGGLNTGNLMLHRKPEQNSQKVNLYAIDNTFSRPMSADRRKQYLGSLERLLGVRSVSAASEMFQQFFCPLLTTFPPPWQVQWNDIAIPVTEGFVRGSRAIAAIAAQDISTALHCAGRVKPLQPHTKQYLAENLSIFRAARHNPLLDTAAEGDLVGSIQPHPSAAVI